MSIETESTAGESIANEASASAKKKTAAAKPKGAPASKTRKAAGRPPQSSRAKPNGEKLICRYCGSDDLAPSFRRRRDARCRVFIGLLSGIRSDARRVCRHLHQIG
jgi:hypothetical protein